ncbi:Metallo-dependent phosphatase-like protein [Scleroderma citrinum]
MAYDPDRWIAQLMECQHLPEQDMKILCDTVRAILLEESNIQPVSTPVTICGDIHGQFWDLLELLRQGGSVPETSYIFMACRVSLCAETVRTDETRGAHRVISWIGDIIAWRLSHYCWHSKQGKSYVARPSSVGISTPHFRYPDKVTLLRGNHESRQITQVYGFYDECQQKYGSAAVWKACCNVFDYLNLAAIIDGETLCVHGGLSPDIRTLDQIRVLSRAQEIPHEGAFCDLMWSDPDDIDNWAVSPRGAGWLFGATVTREVRPATVLASVLCVYSYDAIWCHQFNHVNSLTLIARAHQLVQEGYKYMFDNSLVTVWSAPNYCYRCGNLASVLTMRDGGEHEFKVFGPATENERDKGVGRRNVGMQYFV